MGPDVAEFLHTIEILKSQLSSFRTEQTKLRFQVSKLVEENKKLSNELKNTIKLKLDSVPGEDENLFSKLQAALAAKNAAIEMWQAALCELGKNEELLVGKKSIVATEIKEVDKHIAQIKSDYNKGLNIFSQELSSLRSELSSVKKELEIKQAELETAKKAIEKNEENLKNKIETIFNLTTEKEKLQEKILNLETSLFDLEKQLKSSKDELFKMQSNNQELTSTISNLKEINTRLKSENDLFEKDAKESLLTAQEAILQKKEIEYKEQQALKEIEQLKSSINLEIEKLNSKFRDEIKEIRQKSNEKIQSLMEEIETLHNEINEKHNLFERALRERNALESKLELLNSEIINNGPVSGVLFDDMCKRLTMAEKARDEYELKAVSLAKTLEETKLQREQEVNYLQSEQNNIKDRLQNLLKDYNKASSDRMKLSDEMSRLKVRYFELEKELNLSKNKYQNQLDLLEEEFRQKQLSYENNLHLQEKHHKEYIQQLNTTLEQQYKTNQEWHSTMENLIEKSETKIKELLKNRDEILKHNEELENILKMNNINFATN